MKNRVAAEIAMGIAREYLDFLAPYCEKIEIAGSLRRRKETVGDIEILFIPKKQTEQDPQDMFRSREVDLAWSAIDTLLRTEVLGKRRNINGVVTWGDRNKLGVHPETGIAVDLFTATPENWFNYLVCRTGGAENNVKICNAAIALGWKWNPYGAGFSCGQETHRSESERDVFAFVKLPYLEPWER